MHLALTLVVAYLLLGVFAIAWVCYRVNERPEKVWHWLVSVALWPLVLWVVVFNVDSF